MKDLKGKRLLLLGGSLWKEAIADFAGKNGITLIAAGNNPNAGIFSIADEGYSVNSTDAENMKKLIKEKHIDGVYMGGNEAVISCACQYLADLNMPCYCTKEQWDCLQNKKKFKELCIEAGLPVVPSYTLENEDAASLPENAYPVITKPADGCGSSGFSVCRNKEELEQGYAKAKENSSTGNVIIEKFVRNEAVGVFYTFSNGKMIFSGLEDKYPVHYKEEGSYVAGLIVLKSRFTEIFRELFEDKIASLMKKLKIREGSLWIEVFHDGDNYYFNEVGFRYGGTVPIYPINYFYNINQVASDLYYTLTGESCIKGHPSMIPDGIPEKKFYGVYLVHLKPGTINKIYGLDTLLKRDNIVVVPTTQEQGDIIMQTGSFSQVYARVHIVYDSLEELKDTVDFIHRTLVVEDENGNNMVNRMLDLDKVSDK